MSDLPLPSRIAKIVLVAKESTHGSDFIRSVVAMCACLSFPTFFVGEDAKFQTNAQSDHVSALMAFGAFSHVVTNAASHRAHAIGAAFCEASGLHHRTLVDARRLFGQICALVEISSSPLSVPSPQLVALLKNALLSGYVDRVARKCTKTEARELLRAKVRRRNEWPYETSDASLERYVYLSKDSHVYDAQGDDEALPKWIVYTDAISRQGVSGQKTFLKRVTSIEPAWLSRLSSPADVTNGFIKYEAKLEATPRPTYDGALDDVFGYASPLYSTREWKLPPHKVRAVEVDEHVALATLWAALLSGSVLNVFSSFEYKHDPNRALASKNARNVVDAVVSLRRHKICSRSTLIEAWRRDPTALERDVAQWLKPTFVANWALDVVRPALQSTRA